MLNMLMGLPAGEMSPADADAMRRTMALYGLGSVFKGENAAPTLQSMMMMEMTRNKDVKERAERDRINSIISNIWDTPGASGAQVGSAPRRTSLGRDMGSSEPAGYRGGTVQHGGKTYDMGRSDVSDYASAIASVESGGRYDAVGPEVKGNRAYGKYQVMDFNIGPWTKEVLGRELTPQEFLASPEAQDAVFNAKFGSYVDKYGSPQDAASVWFSGRPMAQAGNASDGFTTVPEYVQRFTTALGQPTQGQGVRVASNDLSAGLGMIGGVRGDGGVQPQQGQRVAQAMPETQMQPGALRMPFTPTGGRMEPGLGQQPQQPQQQPRTRTDWARIAQNIRNSNLPPEEKSRQFQQLRTVMQIERDQQAPDRKTAQDANGRMRYVDTGELVFPEVQQTPKATTLRQNIEWLMSPEGGGYSRKDAVAIAKGGVNVDVQNNMGGKFSDKLGENLANSLEEDRTKAQDAASLIGIIHEGRGLLDEGMVTGAGADYITQGIKLAGRLGIDIPQDTANNTEAFKAVMGNAVAKIIKQFGAGTGLSDADREFARQIVGGSAELNAGAIRRIFDIAEKSARGTITAYGQRLESVRGAESPFDAMGVTMPGEYTPRTPAPPAAQHTASPSAFEGEIPQTPPANMAEHPLIVETLEGSDLTVEQLWKHLSDDVKRELMGASSE